jgi:hypothetical protein
VHERIQGPPRPPKLRAPHEFPPVIEPRLRDMPPYPGPEIEGGFELVESEAIEGLDWDGLARRAQEVAEADERVRERLADHRVAALGASVRGDVRGDGKEDRRSVPVFVLFYDYDANLTVEVELVAEGDDIAVVGVEDVDYQPAPSDDEIERAIALVSDDRRVAGRLTRDLTPRTILVSDVDKGDRHYGTRRIEVAFGLPTERLPRLRTLVDLSAEKVLGVGVDASHEIEEAEGFADTLREAEEEDGE